MSRHDIISASPARLRRRRGITLSREEMAAAEEEEMRERTDRDSGQRERRVAWLRLMRELENVFRPQSAVKIIADTLRSLHAK